MDYEDTVMSDIGNVAKLIYRLHLLTDVEAFLRSKLEAQAKLSFKAGQEQTTEDNYYRGYALGRKAGLKESASKVEKAKERGLEAGKVLVAGWIIKYLDEKLGYDYSGIRTKEILTISGSKSGNYK